LPYPSLTPNFFEWGAFGRGARVKEIPPSKELPEETLSKLATLSQKTAHWLVKELNFREGLMSLKGFYGTDCVNLALFIRS
jgi:hypothetical protein